MFHNKDESDNWEEDDDLLDFDDDFFKDDSDFEDDKLFNDNPSSATQPTTASPSPVETPGQTVAALSESTSHTQPPVTSAPLPTPSQQQPKEPLPAKNLSLEKIEDVPVHIHVEIAHLNIPLSQLMNLTKGNLLELPVSPQQYVHLTVNGKTIAQGELLQVGEVLGVRVIDVAHI